MLICLPCHLFTQVLKKIFGIDVSFNPMKKHINKNQTDIVEDEGKCRTFSFKTPRGIKYTVHTCSISPSVNVCRGRLNEYSTSAHVLCVHGAYSSSDTWHKTMLDMSKRGHTVHAIDLPGFGRSNFPEELMNLPVPDLANELSVFLLKCMESLDIARAILVGHSFGGFVCSICVKNEELRSRVKAMTLVAPAGVFPIGSRWGHLHAVVFRLKMLSFISPDLQSRGENLIMRFFDTGFNGSKWLYPSLPVLLRSMVPCTVVSGTSDPIFTVDHGLLMQEVTNSMIKFKACIFSDHFVKDDSILQRAIVEEIVLLCKPPDIKEMNRRKMQKRNMLLAKEIEDLNKAEDISIGIEGHAFTRTFMSYRNKLMQLCTHIDAGLKKDHVPHNSDTRNRLLYSITRPKPRILIKRPQHTRMSNTNKLKSNQPDVNRPGRGRNPLPARLHYRLSNRLKRQVGKRDV